MTNQTALNTTNKSRDIVESVIRKVVDSSPSLNDLTPEQLKVLAQHVIVDGLKNDLSNAIELARIPYDELKDEFLRRTKRRSTNSYIAYRSAIDALESFARRKGIKVIEMKFKEADSFIHSLSGASSTIRLRISGVSSFFTYLERQTEGRVVNPFRGTKDRPKKEVETPNVPSDEDISLILSQLKPNLKAAVICMLEHGFRVGALPTLTIWGGRYTGISKAKRIDGRLSIRAIEVIHEAGLDNRKPFSSMTADSIRHSFRWFVTKLYNMGQLPAIYSVHDLRHFFAIREYRGNKDIYRLKELLNHANISVTESYLCGIKSYL
jgi:integrase